MRIVITGATGQVGSHLVRLLEHEPHEVILALRSDKAGAARSPHQPSDRPSPLEVTFDFEQPDTYADALRRADKLFLLRPPALSSARRYINPVIDAAKQAGVRHIVFLSILGAKQNLLVPHHAIEKHIISSGIAYTFLRASFFMQNFCTTHRLDIKEHHELFIPAGRGKTSFIDTRDIAAVAAQALTKPGHENQAYTLTGSEALDYFEVADIFTQELGKTITYPNPSIFEFINRNRGKVALPFLLVMVGIYTTVRWGLAGQVTDEISQLLGRSPITLQDFVKDYKNCWE